MRWIVRPSDPECMVESVVGGKGRSLARLQRLAATVPPFLVLSTAAFRQMASTGLSAELIAELREAIAELDTGSGLSVRSSAIGEDAADSSFAGLYHTSLNMKGCDAVVQAIQRCWQSHGNATSRDYREHRMIAGEGAMAVVLQQMVRSEWSGVCFTAHPVKLALSEGLINSAAGLGEALVSGEVNPEEITLSGGDGRVLDRRGERCAALPDAAVAAVWQTSNNLARQLRFPQDVEWAWAGGALFILQSLEQTRSLNFTDFRAAACMSSACLAKSGKSTSFPHPLQMA